jgi:hypothetical protein
MQQTGAFEPSKYDVAIISDLDGMVPGEGGAATSTVPTATPASSSAVQSGAASVASVPRDGAARSEAPSRLQGSGAPSRRIAAATVANHELSQAVRNLGPFQGLSELKERLARTTDYDKMFFPNGPGDATLAKRMLHPHHMASLALLSLVRLTNGP